MGKMKRVDLLKNLKTRISVLSTAELRGILKIIEAREFSLTEKEEYLLEIEKSYDHWVDEIEEEHRDWRDMRLAVASLLPIRVTNTFKLPTLFMEKGKLYINEGEDNLDHKKSSNAFPLSDLTVKELETISESF